MSFRDALWLENVGAVYNARDYRGLAQHLCRGREGVTAAGALAVSAKSPAAMRVSVAAGHAWILGDSAGQAAYFVENDDALDSDLLTAADATNPRIDLLCATITDTEHGAGADFYGLTLATGIPSGTPATPATPANSIRLASIRVDAGVTTIAANKITDLRPRWRLHPGFLTAFTGTKTPAAGTWSTMTGSTDAYDDLSAHTTGTGLLTAPAAGRWHFDGFVEADGAVSMIATRLLRNGAEEWYGDRMTDDPTSRTIRAGISLDLDLAAGDTVALQARRESVSGSITAYRFSGHLLD